MQVLIQAQIRQDRQPHEFTSTSVRLSIPDFLDDQDKSEMIEAGRLLAWNRLFKFTKIYLDR